ncbi:MAG: 2-C-methyl-D-erythritol 2,4-cyclodiphosphate synthase [Moorella sp. 60_41]|nr:MAG: 2-C-methyl-D-erythritol 2,4-cyclodiphosphate synthase [Moorella sp. 60_41]
MQPARHRQKKENNQEGIFVRRLPLPGGAEHIMRIGLGFDVHPLVEGRKLILGGVEIPYERGLAGHSDADVLLHALADALLGAAALGDIGQHFPDDDPRLAGIDSTLLLREAWQKVSQLGFSLANADCVVVAERPRLAPYIPAMRERIADVLAVPIKKIGIKATTTEGLGFAGRGEGIAALATVLLLPSF